MVTRDCAAPRSGRRCVIYNRAALIGVIRHADVGWTGEAAVGLKFKGADVSAVAGESIRDTRVIERAWTAALIKGGASRHARIDRGAAWQQRHRLSWSTVVCERREHRYSPGLVADAAEPRCLSGGA